MSTRPFGETVVQRTLVTGDGAIHHDQDTLGLPQGHHPSRLIQHLLADWEFYYLPRGPNPNFETVSTVKALRKLKYLLGEIHGDGTWEARTAAWGDIPKMREGLKGFHGETQEQDRAIVQRGESKKGVASADGTPLEDAHHYAVGALILVRQMLNSYPAWQNDAEFANRLRDLYSLLLRYGTVALEWSESPTMREQPPKKGSRAEHFMSVGFFSARSEGMTVLKNIFFQRVAPSALSDRQRTAIQTLITETVPHLLELIDTRKMGGGFLGFGESRQGLDPIPNREALTALSLTGTQGDGVAAVQEGSRLREMAMIENIKAGPAPLLVQVGDQHVGRLAGAVYDAESVRLGVDFDNLISVNEPPEPVKPEPEKKPGFFGSNPEGYFPGMFQYD